MHTGFAVADSDIAEDCTIASKAEKDEIDLDDNKLLKEFEDQDPAPGLNMKKIRKEFKNVQQAIKILITGTMGSGKTTLASAMIGSYICEVGESKLDKAKKAKERADLHQRGTIELTEFETKIGQVSVKVWDSPGLQDCTRNQAGYLKQMKENVQREI